MYEMPLIYVFGGWGFGVDTVQAAITTGGIVCAIPANKKELCLCTRRRVLVSC